MNHSQGIEPHRSGRYLLDGVVVDIGRDPLSLLLMGRHDPGQVVGHQRRALLVEEPPQRGVIDEPDDGDDRQEAPCSC